MATKQELKQAAKADFAAEREKRRARKKELAAMPPEERKVEAAKDRAVRKEAKKARKAAIRQMPKDEKRDAKRHDKYYKRLRTRPRRYTVLAALLCLLIFLGATYGPVLGDIVYLMNSTKLTTDTPAGEAARANGAKAAAAISDEGIVLLKNEGGALPLQTKAINVFGVASMNIRYGGGGSGGADQSTAVDLYTGLANAGISYNENLHQYYQSEAGGEKKNASGMAQVLSAFVGGTDTDEPPADYLTEDMLNQAQSFSENALIVLASEGVEASDFSRDQLKISKNKRDLIDKVAARFDNVIIVVNAGNAMELGFLNEYPTVRAALWIGTPGPLGCDSLGKILTGAVNPSGRLTDTYAYDAGSSPASVNFGDYPYTNIKGRSFLNYNEGIYVGYRYYETYYADDEAGYKKAVQFPFGYGLSYTTFNWAVKNSEFGADTISVDVEVKNTGKAPGKEVVQVYFSAPYTPGGIEKSAIELGGFAKTGLIQPGASETVTVTFPTRDMASYDMDGQHYVLEQGTYQIRVGKNVHEIVKSMPYKVAKDVPYQTDEATGTALQNQFDYADGGLKYLSRDNWAGTWPDNANLSYAAPQDVVDNAAAAPTPVQGDAPTTGADNGIMLADLAGLPYDDPKWEQFLDQFTIDEMKAMVVDGAYQTVAVERLGVPRTVLLDGPAGINFFFGKTTAASYPTEVVIASTWNVDLARQMGEAVGDEANAYGVQGWYAPGMNIHRTPQGGRNFEYFSEDPLLSGKMSASMVQGAQSRDILVFMKHFVLNDEETNARSGLFIWANEQAIRELYLRPFEITAKEGEVTGVMSSFVHMGYKWCGGNPELLQNVLRDEWGFTGVVSTDAVLGSFMDLNKAVRSGNDLMLAVVPTFNERYFDKLYKQDPVGITAGARECVHNICYSVLQTNVI